MPIDINRPQSALKRGVRITEFSGHIINPDPVVLQETDFLLDEFLSPTKLKALTGVTDLACVDNLEMIVDTSETSLGNFGIYLPLLKQLKLNGSHVPRIRDLGTSLVNLRVLWLSRSSLTDLDGIPTLSNLEEVYLAFNDITDLSPCSMLENLKCLDLEGNLIDDIKQIEFLNLCTNLTNLTLYGNPICSKPHPDAPERDDNYSYRLETIKLLPELKVLDDDLTLNTHASLVDSVAKKVNKSSPLDLKYQQQIVLNSGSHSQECPFDDDWQLINQFIEEGIGPSEEKLAISDSCRPGTSSSRGSDQRINTGVRPLSSMRPLSSYRIKTGIRSADGRPTSRHTNSSGSSHSQQQQQRLGTADSHISDITNDSSDLTTGPALQGNPLKALMARRTRPSDARASPATPRGASSSSKNSMDDLMKQSDMSVSHPWKKVNQIISEQPGSSLAYPERVENEVLHNELVEWKKDHARKLEERKDFFKPQVLKIEDNEELVALSDCSEDELNEEASEFDKTMVPNKEELGGVESKGGTSKQITSQSVKFPHRAKSAFKQSFDYEIACQDVSPRDPAAAVLSRDKSELSSRSSMMMDRSGSAMHERLATGDTGYESLCNASISSYISLSNGNAASESLNTQRSSSPSLTAGLKPVLPPTRSSSKPKIVVNPLLADSTGNSTAASTSSLKSLKSNLKPLPNIRGPRN